MKKSKCIAGLSNSRGQAAIEYVLLLIISVSLVLALTYQIFRPMQKYVKAYLGDYVECLLETGALPTFGAQSSYDGNPTPEEMGCTIAKFEPGDPNSSGSGGGKGGSGSNPNGDESSGSKGSSSSKSSDSSSSSGSGGSSYAGSASRNGSRFMKKRGAQSGIEASGGAGNKVTEIPMDPGAGNGFMKLGSNGGSRYVQRRKVSAVNMSGWTESDRKKLEKKGDTGRTTVISTEEGGGSAPKRTIVKKPEVKTEIIEDDQPMTIGNFIRYLFIAALIIALVIFIGGQALSMSKGGEN